MIDGWMDQWMDGWIDQIIYELMDRWTVHRHPSPIFFDPPRPPLTLTTAIPSYQHEITEDRKSVGNLMLD